MGNCLNSSEIFDFFVARKFVLHFFGEIWKAYCFRQRSFPKGTGTEMTFSENFVLFLRDKGELDIKLSNRVFRIAQAFLSNVELKSEVQTIFFPRFCEKSFPERLMLFSIVRLRFDCFWLLFMSSHRLVNHKRSVELEDAKPSFLMWICGRTACSQNNFSCRAIEACMFSNVVYVHGHEIFVKFCGVKPSFPKWVREGTTFLEKNCIWYCSMNV